MLMIKSYKVCDGPDCLACRQCFVEAGLWLEVVAEKAHKALPQYLIDTLRAENT
jgi:hypothetical protein